MQSVDVLSGLKAEDSTYVRSTPGSPKNGGSLVTKHLDSDLLSAEAPNGKKSRVDGSSLSGALDSESKTERQALGLKAEVLRLKNG
jgi:hypothetical protein